MLDLDVTLLLEARGHDVGLNGLEIDVGNLSLFTIEDLGNLLLVICKETLAEHSKDDAKMLIRVN